MTFASNMDLINLVENISLGLCGASTLLWISIGTLSRSENGEIIAQRIIMAMCLISALLLFLLHYLGGELWGSRNAARPLAVLAIIVAITASLNIKGRDVQGEINPHQIMKMRKDEK
ncbi:MAG: hypothetical protein ACJZ4Z_03555 [Candidatus Thalassarchaeaceae archaeon]